MSCFPDSGPKRVHGNIVTTNNFKDRTDWFSTKHADWTWLSNCSLRFGNFWKFKKMKIQPSKNLFSKIFRGFLEFSKTGIYVKKQLPMKMCIICQVAILTNGWVLPFSLLKKVTYALFTVSAFFRFWNLSDFGGQKVSSKLIFLRSWRKLELKVCITPPKLKILNLTFIDLVAINDLDLTHGHKRLRRVLRSTPNTIDVVPSALFQPNTAALPGDASNDRQ